LSPTPDDISVVLVCSGCLRESSSSFKALMSDPVVRCNICGGLQSIASRELERPNVEAQVLLRALDKTMRDAENPPK